MKKKFLSIITIVLLLSTYITVFAHPGRTDSKGGHHVYADGWGYPVGTYHFHSKYDTIIPADKETGQVTGITVLVDGEDVFFEQQPANINGSIMVPIRNVAEKMGCSVEWGNETQTVYINEAHMPLEKTAVKTANINVCVNNEMIDFGDYQPVILNGNTLIPIRYVVERLGYTVEWDGNLQIVYIEKAE